jgi:fructose-bisphosphate aldolase, class II
VEKIQLGIKNGVRKINMDTDSRSAMTGAIRKVFASIPRSSTRAATQVIAQGMTEFGQAGHAGDCQPIPLAEMAKRYAHESITV